MIKYLAYCRKSTDDKHKQVLSIQQQLNELKDFSQKENLDVVDYFTESKTAKLPGRQIFNQIIQLIEAGKIQGIISWHPDRLARNSIDGGKIIYLLDTCQLQSLKFPTFWFENTPQGRFMLSMAFSQAKYYVDNLSENVKRGYREKLKRGVLPNKAPHGYFNHPLKRTIEVNLKTAPTIKTAFKLFSSGQYSNESIRKFLYAKGIKNKTSGLLHPDIVKRLLTNPFYYGLIQFGGETYPDSHKPLISKSLFEKCQNILNKKYQPKNKHAHQFAFLGLAKCADCGSAITAEKHIKFYKRAGRHVRYDYYHCGRNHGKCTQPFMPAEDLKEQIRKIIFKYSLHPKNANWMLKRLEKDELTEKQTAESQAKNLKVEAETISRKLERLLDSYLDQIVDRNDYQQMKDKFLNQKLNLEEKIATIQTKGSAWIEPMRNFLKGLIYQQKIAKAKNNDHDLAVMVKKLGSNFFLSDRRLNFSLNFPWTALVPTGDGARAGLPVPKLWQG